MNDPKRFAVIALVLASIAVGPAIASASLILPSTERAMTQRSHLIVLGNVVSVESRWDMRRPVIVTEAIIRVERFIKGSDLVSSSMVHVLFEGGRIGDRADEIDGAPAFHEGEEVLCFLKRNLDGKSFHVFAIYYGKYRITVDAETGRKIVDGPSFHVEIKYDLDTGEPLATDRRTEKIILEDFIEEIESYLKTR